MRPAVPLLAAIVMAGCVQQRTEGDELFGTWSQVEPEIAPGQGWIFHDDLTFERTGDDAGSGIFFVEGTRLTIEDLVAPAGADHVAFDYVATRDHWLEQAAFADGPVFGRVGTWRGRFENLGDPLVADFVITLGADRTARESRHLVGPGRDEIWEGDGTWADSDVGASFRIDVTLIGPGGATLTDSYRMWRLGDAIGPALYERVSF